MYIATFKYSSSADTNRIRTVQTALISPQNIKYEKQTTQNTMTLIKTGRKNTKTRMWANAQRDGRSAKHRWRPLFSIAKFG